MTRSPWKLSLAALALTGAAAACGGKDQPSADRDTTAAMSHDSMAPAAAAGPTTVKAPSMASSGRWSNQVIAAS